VLFDVEFKRQDRDMTSPKGSHCHRLHSKAAGNITGSVFGLIIGRCIDAQRAHAYYTVPTLSENGRLASCHLSAAFGWILRVPPAEALSLQQKWDQRAHSNEPQARPPNRCETTRLLPLARPDSFGPTYTQAGR
jgi:hypothetical protein